MMKLLKFLLFAAAAWFLLTQLRRWRSTGGRLADATRANATAGAETERSPYDVLGVPRDATQDQIHKAYQAMVQQYHPDRVDNMAPELRDLAERRTREINAAYAALKKPT